MKKLSLLTCMAAVVLAVAINHRVTAQAGFLNRVSITFGGGTPPEFIGAAEDILESAFTEGTRTTNTAYSGAFSLRYDRQVSPRLAAGIGFIYEVITEDVVITTPSDATFEEAYKASYPTVVVDGSYTYVNKPALELFGRVGVGLSFVKEELTLQETTTDNSVLFAYQISPIGIRLGKRFFFTSELGFGYMGILSIGAGVRL